MTVVPRGQGCREDLCRDACHPLPGTLAKTPLVLGGWLLLLLLLPFLSYRRHPHASPRWTETGLEP